MRQLLLVTILLAMAMPVPADCVVWLHGLARTSNSMDVMRDVPGFEALNGEAGLQPGTDENSIPLGLGLVSFDLWVIAGNKTVNPILSQSLPNPDDGKVSVERTKVEGMRDFLVVPHSHTFIMQADPVLRQTLIFIQTGAFDHDNDA